MLFLQSEIPTVRGSQTIVSRIFERPRVPTRRPTIFTHIFPNFPQSLQANAGILS
jgi:hypothetical protein